jgi:hypothetical protein
MAVSKIAYWRSPVQGLMRAHRVVDLLPFSQCAVEGSQIEISIVHFVEFLSVGPVGSLYMPIQLRTPGRKDEELDPMFLTSRLEGGLEL